MVLLFKDLYYSFKNKDYFYKKKIVFKINVIIDCKLDV